MLNMRRIFVVVARNRFFALTVLFLLMMSLVLPGPAQRRNQPAISAKDRAIEQ